MEEIVTIIDKNGYILEWCRQKSKVREEEMYCPVFNNYNLVRPRWNGSTWIEGATEEEIKAWQEENKIVENTQPTEEQQLLSTVILENAEIKEQLKEQQELIATILLQNAQLKGDNANV